MSLINDALKRTQQVAQTREPPRLDEIELRPIEPGQASTSTDGGGAKRLIWIVVLVVVTLNIALWILFKDRGNEKEVAARTAQAQVIEPVEPMAEAAVSEVDAPQMPAEVEPADIVAPESPVVIEPPAAEPAVADRPEFHLKTIVTHPLRPSAMINNRVLFVGDRVEGYTVVAIDQEDVTLSLDGDEVVVSLP
jgi:hypothetical protein